MFKRKPVLCPSWRFVLGNSVGKLFVMLSQWKWHPGPMLHVHQCLPGNRLQEKNLCLIWGLQAVCLWFGCCGDLCNTQKWLWPHQGPHLPGKRWWGEHSFLCCLTQGRHTGWWLSSCDRLISLWLNCLRGLPFSEYRELCGHCWAGVLRFVPISGLFPVVDRHCLAHITHNIQGFLKDLQVVMEGHGHKPLVCLGFFMHGFQHPTLEHLVLLCLPC